MKGGKKMVNNSLKNYLNEEYSKEKNYEKIFFKEKDVIKMKKVMLNSVACVLVLIFVGTISSKIYAKIQWDIKFKEFENRELVTETGEIKENWDEGYSENIDMDYVLFGQEPNSYILLYSYADLVPR